MARAILRSFCKSWGKALEREALPASPMEVTIPPFIDNGQVFDLALCPLFSTPAEKQASYQSKSTILETTPFLETEMSQDDWEKSCGVREINTHTGKVATPTETSSSFGHQRPQWRPAIKSLRQANPTTTRSNGSQHLSKVETPISPGTKASSSIKPFSINVSSAKAQIRRAVGHLCQKFSTRKQEESEEELFTERYALKFLEGVSKNKSELGYLRQIQEDEIEAARLAKIAPQGTTMTDTSSTVTATANTPAASAFSLDIITENIFSNTTTAAMNTSVSSLFSKDIIMTSTASDTTITSATTLSSVHGDANTDSQCHLHHCSSLYPRQVADEWLLTQYNHQELHLPNSMQRRAPKATMADFHSYSTWRYGPRVRINQEEAQRREAAHSSWEGKLDSHRVVVDHEEVEYRREAEDRYDNVVGQHARLSLVSIFAEFALGDAAYELEREEEREGRLDLESLERFWAADALVAAIGG
ncbi:hypothetical protein BGZ60DRAFT_60111 [Tricladium varicosporioides]|nr:hypothetical protein BGZ60DRAFT_60111 [Hymenoscyphus varicosporioides]